MKSCITLETYGTTYECRLSPLLLHYAIPVSASLLIRTTILISNEVMLTLYAQHVCGIFAAVGSTLKRIGRDYTSAKTKESPYALDEKDTVYPASCIDRHNDAIEYADLIKSSYAWNLFSTLGIGMMLLNLVGLQILLRTNDLGAAAAIVGVTSVTVFIYYVECHISKILIDHSINIRFCIQNSEWYRLAPKAQKILQLMTIRCNVPCQLTAGNMLVMSMQTFGLTIRTTMSCFVFMRSMHGL